MKINSDLGNLNNIAKEIAGIAREKKFFLLNGMLGSGKTTLVNYVCRYIGVIDQVYSSTFSIINTYIGQDGIKVLHADLYRIQDEEELEMTGFYEELASADIIFIEWANKFDIKSSLPFWTEIQILLDGESRTYIFSFSDK